MKYPRMVRIRQHFKTRPIKDIPAKVRAELAAIQPQKSIDRGDTVAITAGSRGIANLAVIISEIVRELKKVGPNPLSYRPWEVTAVPHPKARKKF